MLHKSNELYVVKLAKAIDIVKTGKDTYTRCKRSRKSYVAELIGVKKDECIFNVLSKNKGVSSNHNKAINIGDYYVCDITPINIATGTYTKSIYTDDELFVLQTKINEEGRDF